jgi:hypothetical protein
MSLRRRYEPARLEAACARACTTGAMSYRSVKSILAAGLDQLPPEEPPPLRLPATHANVRGPEYYADAARRAECSDRSAPVLEQWDLSLDLPLA